MPTANTERMPVKKLLRILKSRRKSIAQIAAKLDTKLYNVSRVLAGNVGGRVGRDLETRILDESERKAIEIMESPDAR